jgi:hypothetical protein
MQGATTLNDAEFTPVHWVMHLQWEASQSGKLPIWTVYDHPTDHPDWADDLGLMAAKPIHAFLLSNSKDPVAGKCLLVGSDDRGETADAQMPLAFLREHVTWLGLILPEVTWDYHETGQRAIVTYSRVKA